MVHFGSFGFTCLLDLVSMVDVKELISENEGSLLGGVLEESSTILLRYGDPIGSNKKQFNLIVTLPHSWQECGGVTIKLNCFFNRSDRISIPSEY